MRRRVFIAGVAAALPLAARAQHSERIRRMGWLDPAPEIDPGVQARMSIVRQGLERAGWKIGHNLEIDYRWGVSDIERARSASAEILSRSPDVILCAASPAVMALLEATRTTPIVFVAVAAPGAPRLLLNFAHPGGHADGVSCF